MSRFANPVATDSLTLPGGCQCPGTPHESDVWVYRTELGDGEEQRAGAYGWTVGNGTYFDWEAARDKLIEIASVRWNVVNDAGPVALSVANIKLLDEPTRQAMAKAVDDAQNAYRNSRLPNPPAAPSVTGSLGSGSSNRATRRRASSTTSSSRPAAGQQTTSGSSRPTSLPR